MYQITYAYSGHSEILDDFPTEVEAANAFKTIINDWELAPHDQYLELEYVSPEGDYETILEHTFNEGNWECED
jgi:adenylate kinase family enzyme